MTEYLILSLNRAVPLVWEYNREITFDVTFSRSYGTLTKSVLRRLAVGSASIIDYDLNSTSKRIATYFKTPAAPNPGDATISGPPRLWELCFRLTNWYGNPQFRIDLHYAKPDKTPGTYIESFTPTYVTRDASSKYVHVSWGSTVEEAALNGYPLEWDTGYCVVLVPTFANATNYARATNARDPNDMGAGYGVSYSNDGGATWRYETWNGDARCWVNDGGHYTVAYAFYYTAKDVAVPVAKSSEAFRSYFNGWTSRTTLPSAIVRMDADRINGVTNPSAGTEVSFSDAYTHSFGRFYTTTDVSAFTQTDVANIKWKYDINPITIDQFYASEAYLQKIEFLDTTVTNRVRLNDSYEQEFSGSGGTSLAFDPPVLWWKAEVLSGRVRMTALVFE